MVGFANESLPGSIRQLKTIGLPLTICSRGATREQEEEKHKCIKICSGRATVPCLPIDISSPTALQNALMASHTIDPGGQLANMEMDRRISYNVASANADFTSAAEGSTKQRWRKWMQAAEAANMGHMGSYAHNAFALFAANKTVANPSAGQSAVQKIYPALSARVLLAIRMMTVSDDEQIQELYNTLRERDDDRR